MKKKNIVFITGTWADLWKNKKCNTGITVTKLF